MHNKTVIVVTDVYGEGRCVILGGRERKIKLVSISAAFSFSLQVQSA